MAACLSQIRVRQKDNSYADVPCGRCGFCLSNKRKEWSFRLQKEVQYHESASFVTLTYSDSNVRFLDDINRDTGECISYPVLVKKHLQDFIKRVRYYQKNITDSKIKYYAVGEYGGKTKRPHYHALLFGVHKDVDIDQIWDYGHTDIGTCTLDSIDYVTKYVVNKKDYKHFLVPPFSCISNGMGLQHLEDNRKLYSQRDIVKGDRGYNQKLPRYYRDKLKKPKKGSSIISAKRLVQYEESRLQEIYRLNKLGHMDPEAYMDERSLVNSERILKATKDNQTL